MFTAHQATGSTRAPGLVNAFADVDAAASGVGDDDGDVAGWCATFFPAGKAVCEPVCEVNDDVCEESEEEDELVEASPWRRARRLSAFLPIA
jgi:hypothetical protein